MPKKRLALVTGLAIVAGFAFAQQKTVKFALDFTIQGPQGMFLLANEKNYLQAEGIAMTIDRGFGSGDTVQKVAAGTYDMGFGDINSVIEFNARNPGKEVIGVAMIYNTPPHAIMSIKGKGINSPKDLAGKTLAAPAGDAARRLFPVYAKAIGIDASKVNFVNVDAPLREPTLARGQADAITGFEFTSVLNLKAASIKEEDVNVFMYSDFLPNLYGNAVIVTREYASKNPDTVKAVLRAFTKSWKDTIAKPDEAVAAILKRDPLLNPGLEKERLLRVLKRNIYVRDVELFGFGAVRKDRIGGAIKLISEAFGLPIKLTVDKVFSEAYLPVLADRLPPKKGF
jgi:NitT/TauT family transport system substrate-binding protein